MVAARAKEGDLNAALLFERASVETLTCVLNELAMPKAILTMAIFSGSLASPS
jgi:hypothetical protein